MTAHRRVGTQWITEILRGIDATFALTSVNLEVQLGELCDGLALAEEEV